MRAYPTANQSLLASNLLNAVTYFIKLPGGLLPMHGRCPNINNGLPPAVLLFDDSQGLRRPDHPRKRHTPLDLKAKRGRQHPSGRPSLDDVERLSMGQAAKKRGTGSRRVCHRLNESERKAYDLAKKKGYVVLRGTGYRKERKGSPLVNIFRQFCDANAMPCISVVTGLGPDAVDEVKIDFSPLRASLDTVELLMERADELASGLKDQTSALTEAEGEGAPWKSTDKNGRSVGNAHGGMMKEPGSGDIFAGFEEEWSEDPNDRPIWALPVVCRVYRCATRREAKDVAEVLSSLR